MINFFRKLLGKKPKYRVKAWNIQHEQYEILGKRQWSQSLPPNMDEISIFEWHIWKHREARGIN